MIQKNFSLSRTNKSQFASLNPERNNMNTDAQHPLLTATPVLRLGTRLKIATTRAQQYVADELEASIHYRYQPTALWNIRCWMLGFKDGWFGHSLTSFREEVERVELQKSISSRMGNFEQRASKMDKTTLNHEPRSVMAPAIGTILIFSYWTYLFINAYKRGLL